MDDMTIEEFTVLTRRLGLDPADFDIAELYQAHRRLRVLMARLEPTGRDPDAEALAVFDPTKAL